MNGWAQREAERQEDEQQDTENMYKKICELEEEIERLKSKDMDKYPDQGETND